MNEIVSEKNFPIRNIWIFKSVAGLFLSLAVFMVFAIFIASMNIEGESGMFVYPVIFIVFAAFNTIYATLKRATFHYSIEDKFLTLRQGIISKQERHIPFGVIQHLFVKQDIFDRIFGLASLAVENASAGAGYQATPEKNFWMLTGNRSRQGVEMAGFSGNKVSIPGLSKSDAEELKNIVLVKMKENPIEDSQSGL